MNLQRTRKIAALVVIPILVVASAFFALGYHPQSAAEPISGTCNASGSSFTYYDRVSNYTVECGLGSVSDGRIRVAVSNYYFSDIAHTNFVLSRGEIQGVASTVLLIVNVSISNTGGGNAPLLGGVYVTLENLTSTNSSNRFLSNGIYYANATFEGFPENSFPALNGGYNLPPGQILYCRMIFVVPRGISLTLNDTSAIHALKLRQFIYLENLYGGIYEGGGQYVGSLQQPHIEFIIIPP